MSSQAPAQLTVASFNVHAGVRRDGSPFDVAGAVASLDADIVVLQEAWWPDDQAVPLAGVAPPGYAVHWSAVGTARLRAPGDHQDRGVLGASAVRMERAGGRGPVAPPAGAVTADPVVAAGAAAAVADPALPAGAVADPAVAVVAARTGGVPAPVPGQRGEIGTAVLSRLPVTGTRVVPLQVLPRDRAARSVVLQTVRVGTVDVEVAGTHMAHLSQGSLRHFAVLRSLMSSDPDRPRLLLGDLNLWGTLVERVLPGWRRAVRGRSWPAAAPVAQPDHVLVGGPLTVVEGRVGRSMGSDHRPVRAVVGVAAQGRGQ